jgi:serine/threonine protein kinase
VWSFGPYRMEELIARGGMGEVHRAHDVRHDRVVAVKLLHEELAGDLEFRERFKREARAAARLREPHVVPIHAYGEIDGRLYLDMRLVEGRDLNALLREEGRLSAADAVDVVGQIASALDAAHAEGLVHRDVKPSNVIVGARGFAYLVDFGIARTISPNTDLTSAGNLVGTLHYMAPERFGPGPIDHRVDVYSLACVLFQCLTGVQPFRPENPLALMYAHVHNEPPRASEHDPGLAGFDHVIATGMAKQPGQRFAGAGDLARAAKDALTNPASTRRMPAPVVPPAGSPTASPPRGGPASGPSTLAQPLPVQPLPEPGRRHAGRWLAITAVVLLLLGLGGVLWFKDKLFPPVPGTGAPPSSSQPVTPSADLGVGTPMSTPECDGSYIVIVGSAIAEDRYADDVQRFLDEHPGAKYLHAVSTGCSSLRKVYTDGTEIYAAYYGPFRDLDEACARSAEEGGGAFVRTLDNTTPPGEVESCG